MVDPSGEFTLDRTGMGDDRAPRAEPEPVPRTIGSYRILRRLGAGGMGVVYEAEQQEPRRIVALKVIRGGAAPDEMHVRMFQREVETLARLEHPNIAAIYEAGRTADGMHWFAMELVRGLHLDAYIASRAAAPAPDELRHRLRLVAAIARAVQFAHQRGVIHRDLKPTNIIVAEPRAGSAPRAGDTSAAHAAGPGGVPEVKILDFGLARLTDDDPAIAETLTLAGAIRGTLPYMSPEQARGEVARIDVRTDVYALGVILYEVLTGTRPYDLARASVLEAVRVICEEPPRSLALSRPGGRRLDQDVATIVGKALEKDPERRYGSAAALAEDLERYLASEPILARPPSPAYQARKFAQRHRALVLGVAATSLAVVAGLVASTGLYLRAERERKSAQQVAAFLTSMLEGVGAQVAQGRDTALLRDILARTTERIGAELGADPEIEARLRSTMGAAYHEIADFEQAGVQWNRALELYLARRGEADIDVAQQYSNLGLLAEARSDYALAEKHFRKAVEIARRAAPQDPRVPQFEARLAAGIMNQGRYDEARGLLEDALAAQRRLPGAPRADLAVTLDTLGRVNHQLGRLDAAEANYREALATHRALLGERHPFVATDLMNTAILLDKKGNLKEAEALLRDACGRFRTLYPAGNESSSTCLAALASLLQRAGKFDEAEPLAREALQIDERIYGARSAVTARSLDNLAVVLAAKGDGAAADEAYARALAIRREVLGPRHPEVAFSLNNLGMRQLENGRYAEAVDLLRQAFEIQRGAAGPDAAPTLGFMNNLARALAGARDAAGAEALFREVIERRRRVLGRDSAYVAVSEYYLSRLLREQGRAAEAEPLQRESVAIMTAALGDRHLQTLLMEVEFAEVLVDLGRAREAEAAARGARERAAAAHGARSRIALEAATVLGKALSAAGRHDEALALLDRTVADGAGVLSAPSLGYARIVRGAALARAGRPREGRAEIEAARAALVATYGPDFRMARVAARELATLAP